MPARGGSASARPRSRRRIVSPSRSRQPSNSSRRQVAFEKALGVEKEIFLSEESVAEEEIFGEGVDEEEVAFEDRVGLRKDG